jgi:type VI secretion system secreted protein Hcp
MGNREGQMSIYLKYGKIDGAATTKGYDKWVELASFQLGVGRAIASAARSAENREASEPSISEITVTKNMDISSLGFFEEGLASEMNNKVTIKFTTTSKNEVTDFLTYELTDVGLSGYSISSSAEGIPTESLSLNFTKIMMQFKGMNAELAGNPKSATYDLTQMKLNP